MLKAQINGSQDATRQANIVLMMFEEAKQGLEANEVQNNDVQALLASQKKRSTKQRLLDKFRGQSVPAQGLQVFLFLSTIGMMTKTIRDVLVHQEKKAKDEAAEAERKQQEKEQAERDELEEEIVDPEWEYVPGEEGTYYEYEEGTYGLEEKPKSAFTTVGLAMMAGAGVAIAVAQNLAQNSVAPVSLSPVNEDWRNEPIVEFDSPRTVENLMDSEGPIHYNIGYYEND